LVLIRDTKSSKIFSIWVGPAVIKDSLSNHTYSVEINGSRKHIHADKIRKYHIQINEVTCDTVTTGHEQTKIKHCAVIYDDDSDSGSVDVINPDQFQQPELLPSQRIDLKTLSHLSVEQRTKLLALLDNYSEKFSVNPRFVTVDQHEFDNTADRKPPRLKVNYMLEDLKPSIEARLQKLFRLNSVHPQRIRGGPNEMYFGVQYRVGTKQNVCKAQMAGFTKIQKLDFWTNHHGNI